MSNNAIINFLFNSQGAVTELDKFKKSFGNAIDSIKNSAAVKLGALGTIIGGAFSVKEFVEHMKVISDLKTKYQTLMSVADISKFSNLIELLGGTDKEAADILDKTQKALFDLIEMPSKFPEKLRGVISPIDDLTGKMKTPMQYLKELREVIKREDWGEKDINNALESLGIYSNATKRFLTLSEEEFTGLENEANKMWVPSDDDIKRMRNFQTAVTRLKNAFRALGGKLLELGIGKLIDLFTDSLNALTAKDWGEILGKITSTVGEYQDKLDEYLKAYDEWIQKIEKSHPNFAVLLKGLREVAKALLHPIETFKKAYNKMAELLGLETRFELDEEVDLKKRNSNDEKNDSKIKQTSVVFKGGTSALMTSKEATRIENYPVCEINFSPVFNGVDEEDAMKRAPILYNQVIKQAPFVRTAEQTLGGVNQ